MVNKDLHVLLVEDSTADAELLLHDLRRGGYSVYFERVDTAQAMQAALTRPWDIIISDYSMPQFNAPQALSLLKASGLDIPFIIVSGTIGEETAVSALLAGANDFLLKGQSARLIPAIERELRESAERLKRREAERKLRESEHRFRLITENAHDLISLTNAEGYFVYTSPSYEASLAYSAETLLSLRPIDLVYPDDLPAITNWEHHKQFEFRLQKSNGKLIWVEASSYPIIIEGEELVVSIGRDVTSRKQSELRLQQYTQRLSILHAIDRAIRSAQSPETICQFTLEYLVEKLGIQAVSIMLFDLETQMGVMFASYDQGQKQLAQGLSFSLKAFPQATMHALHQGQTLLVENIEHEVDIPLAMIEIGAQALPAYATVPLLAHDKLIGALVLGGEPFNLEILEIALEVANQLAIAIQQFRFVTQIQQHAAELEQKVVSRTVELQRTKDRVETILNNTSDAILLTSFDGVVQQSNPSFSSLTGYELNEIFGNSLLILASPDSLQTVLDALYQIVNTGESIRVEFTGCRKDGTQFEAEAGIAAVVQNNKIQSMVCSIRDITQRKLMEQELRATLEKEKELNELKSRFSSMVSHEFRTPLAIILSSAGLLQDYIDRMSEEKKQFHLEKIHEQVQRLVHLLDDVLTLSRADALAIALKTEFVDFVALCKTVMTEVQLTTNQHLITFTVAGHVTEVAIDTKLIREAINNLLSNAIKYSPAGGRIDFDVVFEDNQVLMQVRDQGIGVPVEDQKHLFDTFHRATNVGTISGTGLGLPIVKRAIEAHRGTLDFESELGVGTTFVLTIPINAKDEP